MNEFLRTNPLVVRRQPSPSGTISGSFGSASDGKALKWNWALQPQG
jgi:hypothetical protein